MPDTLEGFRDTLQRAAQLQAGATGRSVDPTVAQRLARVLKGRIAGEVRFDDASRALYATDASNYRQVPIGVVIPRTVDDVVATMAACREFGVPFLSRGGGTSLAGQGCNVAVLVDFSKHVNRLLHLDPLRRLARVEPGIILDQLRGAAEHHHLTFGPDPATHDHNCLGGMLGNNSCGTHSVMAGRTVDNVESLDILTYDGLRLTVGPTSEGEIDRIVAAGGRRGDIYRRLRALRDRYAELVRTRYPDIPRRVSGYNLDELLPERGCNVARALVGSEGTCVAILAATLRLVPSPPARALAVLGFDDIFQAGDAVPRVLEHKPIALEGIDQELVDFMKRKHLETDDLALLPDGRGWLVVELGGADAIEAVARADTLCRALASARGLREAKVIRDRAEQHRIWAVREAGLGGTAFVPHHPDTWEGWEDAAVPPARVGAYLRDFKALLNRYAYDTALYGHFGDGCIHCRINFGLRTEGGVDKWRRFLDEASDLVVRYGGSISGEHGDGQSKAELLGKMFGSELLKAFREFKAIWDPDGRMNPGKVVDPYPITSNLRLGPSYHAPELTTHFKFPDDQGRFGHAAIRCVGVGKCRRVEPDGGVMCPSYLVTHEEKHVTRGRARMLFEMLHGGAIASGWHNDAVEDALSLCLGCKGCKSDCPVNVDMATYKAEFRAHHYAGRLRPRAAYSMGLIHRWAQLAGTAPLLTNLLTQTPGLGAFAKLAGGIAQARRLPRFARQSYVAWHRRHSPHHGFGPAVILFPDTFTNYFRPATAIAATRVLEHLGWQVQIPERALCCGRPLYDWGMLDAAKDLWRQTLATLRPNILLGTPIVCLEPACTAAFRDELINLFPDDAVARQLAEQVHTFDEFLDRHCAGADLPKLHRPALVQFHCHHHAVMKTATARRLLDRIGNGVDVMTTGCCGMAGAFGFEADKHAVSMRIAERALLPKVRAAPLQTTVLADGFSCREQIEQGTGRPTRHLAEAIATAMGLAPQHR